jgi:hypothetical protein
MHGQSRARPQVAIAEWMSSASARSVLCRAFWRTFLFRIRGGYILASSELDRYPHVRIPTLLGSIEIK